ncbi:MAG TPA: FAD-dependent monooxygenase [Burkholderiales bacterium]
MPAAAPDVLIRGAGPVGCALALALADSNLRIKVVEKKPGHAGFRPITLSYASRLILERVGGWEGLPVTPIDTILVSQAGGFGRTQMGAADAGVPHLGYVLDYSALAAALRAKVSPFLIDKEVEPRCTVYAEGVARDAEETRYQQDAVVALVKTEPPAEAAAYERFTAEGPLALLPLQGRYAVVWSASPQRAAQLAGMAEPEFLAALAAAAGRRPGRPLAVEARTVHPLALRVRPARVEGRAVYIGNAAQTLHPVAGQGLNLGLRDAWELAQMWRDAQDPGDASLLARYAARRRLDAAATIRATDWMAKGFVGTDRLARLARGAALTALDVLPGPRRFFARRMIYGPSALP